MQYPVAVGANEGQVIERRALVGDVLGKRGGVVAFNVTFAKLTVDAFEIELAGLAQEEA